MITPRIALFHTDQIRDCEQRAITELGISASELMARAGQAAFTLIRQHYTAVRKLAIYCGSGNNAGDGYVLALLTHQAGYNVMIHYCKPPEKLPVPAYNAAIAALAAGVSCQALDDREPDADLIVDALLGTGLSLAVQEPMIMAINQINDSGLPVLSLDIPSGLDADTGQVMGLSVRADSTITFIGQKTGMMTLDGPDYCGKIFCDDLQLGACLAGFTPTAQILSPHLSSVLLPKRVRNCHKNDFGHVLIVGGSEGMPGSVYLAAHAALRVGAGVVTIATKPEYANHGSNAMPEIMIYGIDESKGIQSLINKATVCVIGPGLGTEQWGMQLFEQVIASQLPVIIDASALRILAKAPQQDDNWVLTPHPGEAASLLGCSVTMIQADRFRAVSLIQAQYGGNVVLKGAGTLVRTDEPATYLCRAGNSGMATAGMGDVLSGVIAGLAAQQLSLADAARLGTMIHAGAADLAVQKHGERGLMATDLMPYLRVLVNG